MSEGAVLAFVFIIIIILGVGIFLAWYFWFRTKDNQNKTTCTSQSDCKGGEQCSGGKCVAEKKCTKDADCSTDEFCDTGGICSAFPKCTGDGDCPSGQICNDKNLCVPSSCPKSANCSQCNQGTDPPSGFSRANYSWCIPNWSNRANCKNTPSGMTCEEFQAMICEQWGGCGLKKGQKGNGWCYYCKPSSS